VPAATTKRSGGESLDAISQAALDLIKQFPDHPARSIARKLVEQSRGAITLESARSRVRGLFGQKGKRQRAQQDHGVRRAARAPGQGVEMPKSQAVPWTVYDMATVGKIGILSDIHCPYHDDVALRAAVDHLHEHKIDALLLNGDFADFYSISRHEKNPKHRNFLAELEQVQQLLRWLRGEFADIKIVAKAGNHEERWEKWLWQHAPELSTSPIMGLDNWLALTELGIDLVGEKRIIMAGGLPILHGHEKGNGISSPVNQARGAYMRLHHTVLEGHGHRTSIHSEPDMMGAETVCFSTGCLCDLRPAYAPINKWNHGAALVSVKETGEFDVENFRISNGKVRTS
jgi:predicted phosphodiesterase